MINGVAKKSFRNQHAVKEFMFLTAKYGGPTSLLYTLCQFVILIFVLLLSVDSERATYSSNNAMEVIVDENINTDPDHNNICYSLNYKQTGPEREI